MLNKSYETSNGLFYKLCTTFTEEVFNYLGMSTIFIDVRDIVTKQGTASDWLSAIGKEINATHYVCAADACTKYLDIKSFTYFGIHIEAQDFILPSNYSVNPTTSILDLLFLYSAVEVSNILRG